MYFGNMDGLWLLAFLIPFIIIYLIKAKPKNVTVPSLIFFIQDRKVKKYNAMLRRLLIRTLFFLQLFFILLVAFSAAKPIIDVPIDAYSLNTIVIMDLSASMDTVENGVKRVDQAKQELLGMIKGRVSLIVAGESPIVLANNITSARAKAIITNIDAKHTSTRLDNSVLLANQILGNEKGNIIVLSDFLLRKDDDILAAKKLAEANDKRVIFIRAGEKKRNVGFINLNLNRGVGEAFFKNFDDEGRTVDVTLESGSSKETRRVDIAPFSVEKISFEIEKGETVLSLVSNDNLAADNKLYVYNPYESKSRILLITNDETSALLDALESNLRLDVEIARPPVIPDLSHDLVILSGVNKNMLLPNTFRDIKKYKDSGGNVIIAAQDSLDTFDFQGLTGFSVGELQNERKEVCAEEQNEFTSRMVGRESGCFASVLRHYRIDAGNNTAIIASTPDNVPIFALENNLFYYGILDQYSGFREQISYPIFWNDVINYMLGRENLANFNLKTGDILIGGNTADKTILDESGIFEFHGSRKAVNLLDAEESNIFKEADIFNETGLGKEYEKVKLEVDISNYLLLLALAVFIFELFYIKRRGDL
ncbi:hypothetical protein GF323_04100 [Candidatus Woesearchaeota archaeon]|nr:hypothetical protein [Candidatus Woesearchaeota archaeon]